MTRNDLERHNYIVLAEACCVKVKYCQRQNNINIHCVHEKKTIRNTVIPSVCNVTARLKTIQRTCKLLTLHLLKDIKAKNSPRIVCKMCIQTGTCDRRTVCPSCRRRGCWSWRHCRRMSRKEENRQSLKIMQQIHIINCLPWSRGANASVTVRVAWLQ